MKHHPPALITVSEAASLLRQSVEAVYKMIQRGHLPGVLRIGRRIRVDSRVLVEWLNQNRVPSAMGVQQ